MKISQKGLYALQALMMLARHHRQGAIKIREIAYEEGLPEKFLELILLELKNARLVESVRGAKTLRNLRLTAYHWTANRRNCVQCLSNSLRSNSRPSDLIWNRVKPHEVPLLQ